jgi:cyclophilin family peptidyl-prolyl cis-trans isomerase
MVTSSLTRIALTLGLFGAMLLGPDLSLCSEPPFEIPPPEEVRTLRSAVIETNRGLLYFELFPEDAPWHVANFKYLADKGFYRGLRFHYFYENYIVQGGAPSADPDSGPGYSIPSEFNARKHQLGSLGMARVKDGANPDRQSHGSQFHILLRDAPHMDGRYTIFGRLTKGEDVLRSLRAFDRIRNVTVYVRQN